jgi:2-polyprenyl-3-methyl-5-hydroxy-6-metoxy-1,4-benzoquinol methylase/predicted O-methyltransferase YrrM
MNELNTLGSLQKRCEQLQECQPLTTRQILEPFGLLEDHPWAETAASDLTNYYACLHGVVLAEQPRKLLEIGTAFGMSGAALLTASPGLELFVSLDLGIYSELLGSPQNNLEFAREHIHQWCFQRHMDTRRVRFYRANTQPPGKGDNDSQGMEVSRWSLIPEVLRLLQDNQFDIIFVDGKHTEDGLLNDMRTFWPWLKPGGLMICDDLHHPQEYAGAFSWVGHTWQSYHRFLEETKGEIADHCIWNFPRVPPAGRLGLRPFGLVRKITAAFPKEKDPAFVMFDSPGALAINRARQDHLASLGLDLANRSVLEVGTGVGWHTAFFERLGCSVVSTDARPGNVAETLHRFPHRAGRVHVADLGRGGSHDGFGDFEVVYCYGTLYHLRDPALCLADLARRCRGLLLLETCVSPQDNGLINPVEEPSSNPNQAFEGIGCRPGRDWLMLELKKHFPYVYISATQPDFPDFELNWPAPEKREGLARAIFVASRAPLQLSTLREQIPQTQIRLQPVLATPGPVVLAPPLSGPALVEPEHLIKDAAVLFHVGPAAAFKELEKNIYAQASPNELAWDGPALVFTPSTSRDHLATKFQAVRLPDTASSGWAILDVRFLDERTHERFVVGVQDQGYNVLAKTQRSSEKVTVRLPPATSALRLLFATPSGLPCLFPEQAVLSVAFPDRASSASASGPTPAFALSAPAPAASETAVAAPISTSTQSSRTVMAAAHWNDGLPAAGLPSAVRWPAQPRQALVSGRLAADPAAVGAEPFGKRLREKWCELPGTRRGRARSSDLLALSDGQLLEYWEACRRETSGADVRGWYQDLYREKFAGLDIADIGSGLGIDSVFFAEHGARVTFADIVEENLMVLRRLAPLKKVQADFYYIDDFFHFHFDKEFDVLLCIGSLLNAPFEFMQREVRALSQFLRVGGRAVVLAYPKERFVASGAKDFAEFAKTTDGERTPWCEWYDDDKTRQLFGESFRLNWSRNFGNDGIEFNWFDLTKEREPFARHRNDKATNAPGHGHGLLSQPANGPPAKAAAAPGKLNAFAVATVSETARFYREGVPFSGAPLAFSTRVWEYPWVFLRLKELGLEPEGRILDVGCACNPFMVGLSKMGYSLTGLDLYACNDPRNSYPKFGGFDRKLEHAHLKLCEGAMERIPLPDASFDAVMCLSVIEHCAGPVISEGLREMMRVLKPGGALIITEDHIPLPCSSGQPVIQPCPRKMDYDFREHIQALAGPLPGLPLAIPSDEEIALLRDQGLLQCCCVVAPEEFYHFSCVGFVILKPQLPA